MAGGLYTATFALEVLREKPVNDTVISMEYAVLARPFLVRPIRDTCGGGG